MNKRKAYSFVNDLKRFKLFRAYIYVRTYEKHVTGEQP
jgi:hypothetical protein